MVDGRLTIRLPLTPEEQLYGLGLQFKTVHQRGRVRYLQVDHYGGKDNGRTHAPVPFYVSSSGYGVLIDTARPATVYAGSAVRVASENQPPIRDRNSDRFWDAQPPGDEVEVLVPAAGAELLVFGGNSPLEAVRRYNLFSGGGVLPPKWGLGFLHRTPTKFSAEEVLEEVDAFEDRNFPLDIVGLEPGWQSRAYPGSFTWDPERFPDPEGFLEKLRERGIGTNLWLNPYVSPESPIYEALLPRSGSHMVWGGIVPDYTEAETQNILIEHFRDVNLKLGVTGYKIDETDGYDFWLWPNHATFPSGMSGERMRQVYGVLLQRMVDDLYRSENLRTYGLTRASNAGSARLPFVIYNDYYNHRDFITALVNSSFLGVLWTPEARSSKSAEEWVRRMQSVCFSPLAMLNAWASGTKPWSFPEVEDAVRDVMFLRLQFIPYMYTAFAQYHFEGVPPFRAMPLVDGFLAAEAIRSEGSGHPDKPFARTAGREIKDQYMVGENLLVSPMFAGEKTRNVTLPPGRWYDFYTGDLVGENEVVNIAYPLERIPLFVRDGGLIPLIAPSRQAPKPGDMPALEVRHYGESAGSFRLYDDDGLSFNYEDGAFSWTDLNVSRNADGKLFGSIQRPAEGLPFNYSEVTWRMMTEK